MTQEPKYLFTAAMDIDPMKEAVFNEVYDEEHIPYILTVPGVISVARYETQKLQMFLGGEMRSIEVENEPKHHAIYELESPEVLTSPAWAKAVEAGRWPTEVRPYTRNRRLTLKLQTRKDK